MRLVGRARPAACRPRSWSRPGWRTRATARGARRSRGSRACCRPPTPRPRAPPRVHGRHARPRPRRAGRARAPTTTGASCRRRTTSTDLRARARQRAAAPQPRARRPDVGGRGRAHAALARPGGGGARAGGARPRAPRGPRRRPDPAHRARPREPRAAHAASPTRSGSARSKAMDRFNVTALDRFGDCSAWWFVERMLDPRNIDQGVDPLMTGAIAHTVLHRFYRQVPATFNKQRLEPADADRAQAVVADLVRDAVRAHPGPTGGLLGQLLERRLIRDLGAFVRRDAEQPSPLVASRFEVSFGGAGAAPGLKDGLRLGDFAVVGKIDRIDTDPGMSARGLMHDYKAGVTANSAVRILEDGRLQIPLYLLALRELLGLEPVGGLFRALGPRRHDARAAGRRPRGRAPAGPLRQRRPADPDFEAAIADAAADRRAARRAASAAATCGTTRAAAPAPPSAPGRASAGCRDERRGAARVELDADQERAVSAPGAVFVDAGAGAGKTRVLVERFSRAVLERGVAPDRILAITFTERAAGELVDRIRARLREAERADLARDLDARLGLDHPRLLQPHPAPPRARRRAGAGLPRARRGGRRAALVGGRGGGAGARGRRRGARRRRRLRPGVAPSSCSRAAHTALRGAGRPLAIEVPPAAPPGRRDRARSREEARRVLAAEPRGRYGAITADRAAAVLRLIEQDDPTALLGLTRFRSQGKDARFAPYDAALEALEAAALDARLASSRRRSTACSRPSAPPTAAASGRSARSTSTTWSCEALDLLERDAAVREAVREPLLARCWSTSSRTRTPLQSRIARPRLRRRRGPLRRGRRAPVDLPLPRRRRGRLPPPPRGGAGAPAAPSSACPATTARTRACWRPSTPCSGAASRAATSRWSPPARRPRTTGRAWSSPSCAAPSRAPRATRPHATPRPAGSRRASATRSRAARAARRRRDPVRGAHRRARSTRPRSRRRGWRRLRRSAATTTGAQAVGDLLAYLRLIRNRFDDVALLHVLASPLVGVTNDGLLDLRDAAPKRRALLRHRERTCRAALSRGRRATCVGASASASTGSSRTPAELPLARARRAHRQRPRLRPRRASAAATAPALREPAEAGPAGAALRGGARAEPGGLPRQRGPAGRRAAAARRRRPWPTRAATPSG